MSDVPITPQATNIADDGCNFFHTDIHGVPFDVICTDRASKLIERGTYEGGYSVWECSKDLIHFLNENQIHIRKLGVDGKQPLVLEIGCGHGLPGSYLLRHGIASSVTFQDLNRSVILDVAIPSVIRNSRTTSEKSPTARFLEGSWKEVCEWTATKGGDFDLIIASEVTYRPSCYEDLIRLLLLALREPRGSSLGGHALIAMKRHYFGLGGGTLTFTRFLHDIYNDRERRTPSSKTAETPPSTSEVSAMLFGTSESEPAAAVEVGSSPATAESECYVPPSRDIIGLAERTGFRLIARLLESQGIGGNTRDLILVVALPNGDKSFETFGSLECKNGNFGGGKKLLWNNA